MKIYQKKKCDVGDDNNDQQFCKNMVNINRMLDIKVPILVDS